MPSNSHILAEHLLISSLSISMISGLPFCRVPSLGGRAQSVPTGLVVAVHLATRTFPIRSRNLFVLTWFLLLDRAIIPFELPCSVLIITHCDSQGKIAILGGSMWEAPSQPHRVDFDLRLNHNIAC